MTIAEMARLAGEHPTNLYRWLSGERRITLKKALEVAEKTGLPHTVFSSAEIQARHFGRVFLRKNESNERSEK
jgi:transcriptional regulator with XRE-family HTH domain